MGELEACRKLRLLLKGEGTDSLFPNPSAEAAVRKVPGSYKKEIHFRTCAREAGSWWNSVDEALVGNIFSFFTLLPPSRS